MRQILNNLPLHYPCKFSYQELQEKLGDKLTGVFENLNLLQEDRAAKSIFCPNCQNEHDIVIHSKKEAFVVCTDEDTGRIPIDPQTLKVWQFNLPKFLELAAKELKIKSDIKSVVVNDLWLVGTLQKNGKHFLVFYSRTNDLNSYSTFFDDFKSPVRAFVVFTNTETPPLKNERVKAVIPLADIVEIENKSLVWNTKLFQEYLLNALRQPKVKTIFTKILIKDVRLDEQNYLLEINNGEKIISFKSKKKGEGLEKETKQFKILYHLWDFRWELKDGIVLKKGDYTSLDNLAKGSGTGSTEAAYKHIQRLNNRFKNEGVAIEIKGQNEKYRLIINKA